MHAMYVALLNQVKNVVAVITVNNTPRYIDFVVSKSSVLLCERRDGVTIVALLWLVVKTQEITI